MYKTCETCIYSKLNSKDKLICSKISDEIATWCSEKADKFIVEPDFYCAYWESSGHKTIENIITIETWLVFDTITGTYTYFDSSNISIDIENEVYSKYLKVKLIKSEVIKI